METVRAFLFLLLCCLSSAVPQNNGGLQRTQGPGGQMGSYGVGNEPIQISALGRPFSLGMFYDSRSDTLVPGLTLWDKDKLDRDKTVIPQPNTEFHIMASESISEKSSSLGVDASLKASFLSGLVNVGGSAKYLKDDRTSKKQARVTLQYKTTTVFKALSMDQLGTGNLEHSEVIEKGLATHVVTGILYGAQAFFVFSQESSEEESLQDIPGNLHMMISKIPSIQIDGSGALTMEDTEREKVRKFSCTFYGDFHLTTSPTIFEEAVKVYQTLPELLGLNGENAVPVVVYLLPLSTLDSRASRLVCQISIRLVSQAENILEDFTELEMWSNDVLKSPAGQNFPQISKSIKTFKALCSEFKLGLQGTMAQKLPSIRGGGEAETALAEVLQNVSRGPFNIDSLNRWMEDKDDQANTIKTIMKQIKNIEMVSKNALADKVIDSEKTLVFEFTFLRSADPFLSELEQHLKDPQSPRSDSAQPRHWYSSKDVINNVIRKAKRFGDFIEANKDKKNIQFLALGLTDENHEGSTVHLYEDGTRVSENFASPSKPRSVTVREVTHDTVKLTFRAPSYGQKSITGYRVEFCEKGQEEWNHQLQAEAGTVTVTGLKPKTEYSVRVRAITAVGVGPAAKTSIRSMTKDPCKFLLDPNTVSRYLRLSEDLRSVTYVREALSYPDHQDRFTFHDQVLSSSGLRGCCYFEVDWSVGMAVVVDVAVSYRRICRRWGYDCLFGRNDHSWRLRIDRGGKFIVLHNDKRIYFTGRVGVYSGRVGVYLDWEGGALSFYDITNGGQSHLYTIKTNFTEELLPGFYLNGPGTVSVVELNQD